MSITKLRKPIYIADYLEKGSKANHTRHSAEYKQESLKLAAQIGVAKAAKQLGLHESQLYAWRKQSEYTQSVSQREANLATENARLKRQLAQQLKRGTNS